MLGALIFLLSILLGWSLLALLPLKLYRLETLSYSIILGLFAQSWLGLLIAVLAPLSLRMVLIIAVSAGLIVPLAIRRWRRLELIRPAGSYLKLILPWSLFTAATVT
ncbi:hypothetical protein KGQ71_02500, partial [Patescibacteria group bacterium]|nr:hypothetical protein [Patescibacteria group bacterium]